MADKAEAEGRTGRAAARSTRPTAMRSSRRAVMGRRSDRSLRESSRVRSRRQGRARAAVGRLRPLGGLACCGASCRRCGPMPRLSLATSRPDPIRPGRSCSPDGGFDALVRRRAPSKRASIWNGSGAVPTRPGRRFGLSFRTRRGRRGDALPRAHVVAAGRHWARGFPRSRRRGADRGPPAYRYARTRDMACGPGRTDARRPLARARNAVELVRLTREHDLPMWRALGIVLEGVAKAESGELIGGLADMRRGVDFCASRTF